MIKEAHVINCQEEYAQAVSQKEFCRGFLSMLIDKYGAELEHERKQENSRFSGISAFIQLSNAYSACVVSNLFGLNPTLHLILLNVIFHQYCCIFFVSYTL